MKGAALTLGALGPHLSTHQFAKTLADSKTEPGIAISSRDRCINLAESLEESTFSLGGDADPGVSNREMQGVSGGCRSGQGFGLRFIR